MYGMAAPPSPLAPTTDPGAEIVRWVLHKTEHLCLKPEPLNLSQQWLLACYEYRSFIRVSYKMCYGVWIEEWYWGNLLLSLPLCCLHVGWLWIGIREGMLQVYWLHDAGGLTAFPWFPPSLFNGFVGVAHSLAIWPQSWHLKHCNVLESFAFWALPWTLVDAWVLPLLCEAVATCLQQKSCEQKCFGPGQSDHCGSWGRQECSCPSALSHDPCAWDYLEF